MVGCVQTRRRANPGAALTLRTQRSRVGRLTRKLFWLRLSGADFPLPGRGSPNQPTGTVTTTSRKKGLAMSEEWGISRVGKLEVEVGETLQEAIIRLQILPLPPLAWTDCFLQTVRGHQVTITGTETHPDKIEAVARPAEVEDVVEKIDSAIENANNYVKKVVLSRRQADPDIKNAEADERQRLQAELDQLAEKLSKPEYSRSHPSAPPRRTKRSCRPSDVDTPTSARPT